MRGVLGRVDLEVVQEEGEGLVVVLVMEQIEELDELLGGDGARSEEHTSELQSQR